MNKCSYIHKSYEILCIRFEANCPIFLDIALHKKEQNNERMHKYAMTVQKQRKKRNNRNFFPCLSIKAKQTKAQQGKQQKRVNNANQSKVNPGTINQGIIIITESKRKEIDHVSHKAKNRQATTQLSRDYRQGKSIEMEQ